MKRNDTLTRLNYMPDGNNETPNNQSSLLDEFMRLQDEFMRLQGELEIKERVLQQYKTYVTDLERRLQKLLPQSEARSAVRDALQGPTLFDPHGQPQAAQKSPPDEEQSGDKNTAPPEGPRQPPSSPANKPKGRRPLPPHRRTGRRASFRQSERTPGLRSCARPYQTCR